MFRWVISPDWVSPAWVVTAWGPNFSESLSPNTRLDQHQLRPGSLTGGKLGGTDHFGWDTPCLDPVVPKQTVFEAPKRQFFDVPNFKIDSLPHNDLVMEKVRIRSEVIAVEG
jgi:hypothetical protein